MLENIGLLIRLLQTITDFFHSKIDISWQETVAVQLGVKYLVINPKKEIFIPH